MLTKISRFNHIKTCFAALLFLFASACSSPREEMPAEGKVEDHTYVNSFFGLEVTLPEDWHIQDKQHAEALQQEAKDQLDSIQNLEAASENIINLVSAFQNPIDDTLAFNPSFVGMAEKLPTKADMTERVYLMLTQKQLSQTGMYSEINNNVSITSLDEKSFYKLSARLGEDSTSVTQDFYVKMERGYALIFITSYQNETQKKSLEEILESIQFED